MNYVTKKKQIRYAILIICIYISTFYPLLELINPVFSYWDEFFVVALMVALILKGIKLSFFKDKCFLFFVLFIFIGVINTCVYRYQPIGACFEDVVSFIKFPAAIAFSFIFFNGNEINNNGRRIIKHLMFISTVLLALLLFNQIANIFPVVNNQIPIFRGEMLFYSHPTYLAGATCFLICLYFLVGKNSYFVIFTLFLLVLSTTRVKAIAWLAAVLIIYYYVIKKHRKMNIRYAIPVAGVLVLIAKDKIITYFLTYKDAARGLLYSKAFEIFNDYFPLGLGFATFGSGASTKYYSPIYYSYGMSNVYGFTNSLEGVNYISDTFWPIIIAEFGIFGLIAYALFLFLLFLKIQNLFKIDKISYFVALCSFAYLAICSIAESAFVNPIAVPLGVLIGYTMKSCCMRKVM